MDSLCRHCGGCRLLGTVAGHRMLLVNTVLLPVGALALYAATRRRKGIPIVADQTTGPAAPEV